MLKILYLSAACAALIAGPAAAQSLDQPQTDDSQIVVTAARAEQSRDEVGQAITVIDRAEIERRQTVVVSDLLATTPGVSVTRNGSVGGLTAVRLRGAEGDQTLVVIDGVRVNDPSSTGGGFDFANLLSSSVERIEVLRGPNSVPWGSQAIGGVVNIMTRTPTEGFSARANAEYGYADQVFASAGVAGGTGALSGSLTGGYLRTDGISAAADGAERDGYRQYGANGRLGLELAPGIGIDLRGWYAHSRAGLDGYPPPNYSFADTSDYSTTQEIYGYAGAHADLAGGRLRNRIAFTIADINRDNYEPAFGADPSFFGRGRSERYEYQGDFRIADPVRLIAGAEHENSRYTDGGPEQRTGITSVYGELIVQPVRQLTLTGGVRHDDHRRFGGRTTFGADAALALDGGTTLRASYGEGFKAPTLYQLYSAYGNVTLDPETARSFDAGVEQALLDGRARIGVTYFNRVSRNQIVFRSCSQAEQATAGSICVDRLYGVYDNIQRTRADGFEAVVALRPVDTLDVSLNYTRTNARNRQAGADFGKLLARRPQDAVNLNVDWQAPFGLALGSTVSVVGDSFDNAANTVRLDGYVLAGVRAELPIGPRLALYGRVENLFDARYQTVSGYGTYGRAAYAGVRVRLG
ncbi:TonB-dependent receptor [Sphingomonas metalli]|uniref:TonB-dependent receptor n=1 Tax=Sphingomonas metalli TaxID=1779358 RepID=A0A916SV50_9SPHN|nr:TonB-dependent receptor [Sphingomonas metalli]GGB17405.1 TonB-dependent receptor [Sphingomonas metalli]